MEITKEMNNGQEIGRNEADSGVSPRAAGVQMVSLNKSQTDLNIGAVENLLGTVFPTNAIDKTLTWTTSNANVATVSPAQETTIGTVTAVGVGTAVITATASNGKYASCTVSVVKEREFHLISQSGNGNALYLGNKNLNILDYDDEVRDKRVYTAAFTYSNREKWVFRWDSDGVKIHTAANKNFALCKNTNEYADLAACVSENATDSDSKLTVSPYGSSSDLFYIKLKNSDLYLTSSDENVYWQSYNSSNPTNQIWKLKDKPANIHYGLDTCEKLTDNDIGFLVRAGEEFVCRYYKPTATHDYLLTSSEVNRLHNAGISIVSVYQSSEDVFYAFSETQAEIDADAAIERAHAAGQPEGTPIYFAIDYGLVDTSNPESTIDYELDRVVKYFVKIKSKFDTSPYNYKIGVYGCGKVCQEIKQERDYAEYSWLAQSTGYPETPEYDDVSKYNIKQAEYVYYNGKRYDEDIAVGSDYGQW